MTTPNPAPLPEELDLLAAEYAMGMAEGAELARAVALESSADDFRAAVTRWRSHFLALDDTAAPLTPAPALWDKIAAQLDVQTLPETTRPVQPRNPRAKNARAWDSLLFWRGFGLATAFTTLLLAFGLMSLIARGPESPVHVAVLNTADGRAAAVVNAYANGTAELIPLEQIQVPEGRIIEVWTLQTREQGPVSIGRINQARRIKLDLKQLKRPEANHLFELTLEPQGGSPTGKPTGPILMKGLAAKSV